MALEAIVYPQDPFTYVCKDFYPVGGGGGGAWGGGGSGYDFCFQEQDKALAGILNNNNIEQQGMGSSPTSIMQHTNEWRPYSSPETCTVDQSFPAAGFQATTEPPAATAIATTTSTTNSRRKRRRAKSGKNKEELEKQRMTHITVERNRRKQMNEYLAVIRTLMPPSYVQRGDQASIIGGAINFVKELEQLLQFMEAHKRATQQPEHTNGYSSSPFAEFFAFPQFSTRATQYNNSQSSSSSSSMAAAAAAEPMAGSATESVAADIEVTMVETHANVKILSKKRPRQLLELVAGLQSLRLTILHLNVTTTVDEMAMYSISVKVEEGSHLSTVNEIAAAVNQILHTNQEEAALI